MAIMWPAFHLLEYNNKATAKEKNNKQQRKGKRKITTGMINLEKKTRMNE